MWINVFAGYLVDSRRLKEWSEAQTDDLYVRCRKEHRSGTYLTLRHYIQLKGWSRHIGVTLLPHPKDQTGSGKTVDDRWYTMFYRREGQYRIPLSQFSDWGKYKENDLDVHYSGIIQQLGFETFGGISQWKVVAWVGRIGLFYDFSPEVMDGLRERIRTAKAKKAERAKQVAAPASVSEAD